MASAIPEATVRAIAQANWARLAERPVRAPDHFIAGFYGDNVSVEYLLSLLDRLPDGNSELMTHPGYSDETLVAESASRRREDERGADRCGNGASPISASS
jgi:predicted glycoside hydrolase/deacetylase ChbG (UPF0249 family)